MTLRLLSPRFLFVALLVVISSADAAIAAEQEPPTEDTDELSSSTVSDAVTTGASWRRGNVMIVSAGFTIDRILAKFQEQGVKVVARGKVFETKIPSFIVRNVPARDALVQLVNSQPNWLLYEPADAPGTYEIWDQESYRREVLPKMARPKTFVPKFITAEDAWKAIQGLLTPHVGTAAFDPRSNKVFVTDLVPVLERIERQIEQIDIKLPTRVFYIAYGDVNSIGEKLSHLKSPAAPAPEVDERTRQIIVTDRLDIIRQMELLVETLDIASPDAPAGTPLQSWRVAGATQDSVIVEDLSRKGRSGQPLSTSYKVGSPAHVVSNDVDATVTLTKLPDAPVGDCGSVAVFKVEYAPMEVKLPIRSAKK
jgi:hypothetical protein